MKYYVLGVSLEESKSLQDYLNTSKDRYSYSMKLDLTSEEPELRYRYEDKFMIFYRFTVLLNEADLSALLLMFNTVQVLPCSRFIRFLNLFRRKS